MSESAPAANSPTTDRSASGVTVDPDEIAHFSAIAAEWWNPHGKFGVLHRFNPVRLGYIKEKACAHFGLDPDRKQPLAGLRVLDIGCGGGLLSEPMARMGAEVIGVDPSEKNIKTATVHARERKVPVDFRIGTAEALAEAGERFDIVLNMEVVEHVTDMPLFVATCASMVRPGGLMFVATINRTLKAWGLAIFGAEVVLRWLPRGTHAYEKLVTPAELQAAIEAGGLVQTDLQGVSYNPLNGSWNRSRDTDVNYMVLAERSGE